MNSALKPHTLVILLFRLKLIQVHIPHWYHLKDLLADILYSGKHDLPTDVEVIMRPYKPRNLRFFTLKHPFSIHDLNNVPDKAELKDLIPLHPDSGTTISCANHYLPSDGSCLNLVVEEPLPIEELSKEGDARFMSREVIVYLNEHNIQVKAAGYSARAAPGFLGEEDNLVFCKLIGEGELETFETLKSLDPSAHHIVSLLLPPHHLPTGQYLITMPDYGYDLSIVMKHSFVKGQLSGTRIQIIARQLCEAIQFLHSHNLYHLDIKPQNLAINDFTSDLTVIDLGWVSYGVYPCSAEGAAGTPGYVAPEVERWFEWEETEEGDMPPFYNPRKADAWAIGNVIDILLSKEGLPVAGRYLLECFSEWMMDQRPSMDSALEKLEEYFDRPTPTHSRNGSSSSLDGSDISS